MDISSIVDISVSVEAPGVSKPGFGTPLLYGYNSVIPASAPVKRYSSATWSIDMLADGFVASDPLYIAARILCSQDPKPRSFKIARATQTPGDHDVDLTVQTAVAGEVITISITGENPSVAGELLTETYSRTVPGASSTTAEATALAALITAGAWGAAGDITATGVGAVVQIRGQAGFAGKILFYDDVANLLIDDVTAARTVATDLATIFAYDPDWYALIPVDSGTLDAIACSAWAEAQDNKICVLQTQDSDVWNAGTGIAATLKALNSQSTLIICTKHGLDEMPAAAVAGRFLPKTPGTEVWAMKALTGVTPSSYTAAQSSNAHDDFCNTYDGITIGGVEAVSGILFGGWSLGSSATFIDMIRLRDAMVVEVQSELLSLQLAADKVPFNDAGIAMVQAAFLAAIRRYEGPSSGLEPGSAFCNVPTAASVSSSDRAARQLPGVSFGARANGAIIKVTASGSISV